MELNTIEKFSLIAHHPEKWWFKTPQIQLKYGLSGALLLEFSMRESIELVNERVQLKTKSKIQDKDYPILDEFIEIMIQSNRLHKPKYWIQKFGRKSRKLKWEILRGLEKKRLMRIEHSKFIFIPYRRAYLTNRNIREKILHELRDSLTYKKTLTEEDIAILGLIEACKMYRILSPDRSKRRQLKKDLRLVLKESPISEVVQATIRQIKISIAIAVAASSAGAAGAGR